MENYIWNENYWVEILSSVKIWSKWQIVIPSNIRKSIWLKPWDNLIIWTKYDKLVWIIKPSDMQEFTSKMDEEINSNDLNDFAQKASKDFKDRTKKFIS